MESNSAQARLYPAAPNSSTPSLVSTSLPNSPRNSFDVPTCTSPSLPITGILKTICNRGSAMVSIHLAEPVLYLTGFEPSEYIDRAPAILRGSLILKLLKPAKLKSINLTFKGRARTEWPEGIPPRKVEFSEEKELMTHTWTFFNAQFPGSDTSHGADATRITGPQRHSMDITRLSTDSVPSLLLRDSPVGTQNLSLLSADGMWGIPLEQSRSYSKEEKTATQLRGYRIFAAGEYTYNFELPIDSILPESIECDMGSVRYELEANIERAGAFKSNLSGKTEVLLVRNPSEQNMEIYEPISIARTWEDQLHYEILISGKAFPLHGVIPIAFKFTPLAKVRLHRIKVFLSENVEYRCRDKKIHRTAAMRRLLLFEKQAHKTEEAFPHGSVEPESSFTPYRSSGIQVAGRRSPPAPLRLWRQDVGGLSGIGRVNVALEPSIRNDHLVHSLLGNLEGGDGSGVSTEFEVMVPLPGCQVVRTPSDTRSKNSPLIHVKFNHTTIWPNIIVHHWIKIVLRISKAEENSSKRRHFEISIDSPIHLLSCRSQANTYLPAYSLPSTIPVAADMVQCPCRSAARSTSSQNIPNQPSPLSIHRPMHLMRQPSTNPPSFYDDVAPPPLMTPPPDYDDLTPRVEVRDGYFDGASESNSDENIVAEPDELQYGQIQSPDEMPDEEIEEEFWEEDIVDMLGLEDLNLGLRRNSPITGSII